MPGNFRLKSWVVAAGVAIAAAAAPSAVLAATAQSNAASEAASNPTANPYIRRPMGTLTATACFPPGKPMTG